LLQLLCLACFWMIRNEAKANNTTIATSTSTTRAATSTSTTRIATSTSTTTSVPASSQCPLVGQMPQTQSGSNNYVLDTLSGSPFAFAIGYCTATSLLSNTKWYKYDCIESATGKTKVTKTEYNDVNCTGNGTLLTNWPQISNTSNHNSTGTQHTFFECDGYNTYAEIVISTNQSCSGGVTVYAALGTCVNSTFQPTQLELYCNNTEATLQIFTNTLNLTAHNGTTSSSTTSTTSTSTTTGRPKLSTTTARPNSFSTTRLNHTLLSSTQMPYQPMCGEKYYCNNWVIPQNNCSSGRILATVFNFQNRHIHVYGQMKKCYALTTTTTAMKSALPSLHSQLALISLFSLLLFTFCL